MYTQMKRLLTLCAAALVMLTGHVCPAALAAPDTGADSAILVDAATGRTLYEKNADASMLIASTTKIMTALIALETAALNDTVTIPPEAVGVEGSSMYAKEGETYPLYEMLNGLMLLSGNDAAVALAVHCAGSVESFATLMNSRASELGMKNSHFENPHGLWDVNRSSARDMALLAKAAMESTAFQGVVSQRYGKVGDISVKNHNRLLWSLSGCDGIKTGFTKKAGRCLVSSAMRDGSRFIAVTLKDGNDWADHTAMLEHAFSAYPRRVLLPAQSFDVGVLCGIESYATLKLERDIAIPLTQEELSRVVLKIDKPYRLWAPVTGGQQYGTVKVYLDGVLLQEEPLCAEKAVPTVQAKKGWFSR